MKKKSKRKWKTIFSYVIAIGLYSMAFYILRDTFIREILAIILVMLGTHIQGLIR